MFFYASKIIWFFLQPSSLILFLLVTGFVLTLFWKIRAGRRLMLSGLLLYVMCGYFPIANLLIVPLENRFDKTQHFTAITPPDGIIVLGGALETVTTKARGDVVLNEAAERMNEAVVLARKYPKAQIIFSGGNTKLVYDNMSESQVASKFFADHKINPNRLILENKSKNTYQNAVFTAKILENKLSKNWLLITSAYHMPRSIGAFRKAGLDVQPWPVDYRTRGWQDIYRFFDKPSNGLRRTDQSTREWIGLIAYYITGKTPSLLPGN